LGKIAFILKGYPRLSETFISNEILLLEQQGFNIHIFALRNPGESKIHESVKKIRASVTYIPDNFWWAFFPIVLANIKQFFRRPRRYFPAFRYALWRSLKQGSSSTIKRFSQAAFLVENGLLRNPEIQYLHAHFSHGPTTVAYFASRLSGLKYSFSAHAKDIYLQEPEFFSRKIRGARFVVTCTEFNRQYMRSIAGETDKIFRVYHGVDVERFHPRHRLAVTHPIPRILSVGRFVPKKGFQNLIRALAKVKALGHAFRCDIIGGGPLEEVLQELVVSLGLQDNVTLHGKMSQEELFPYFQRADLFALACEIQDDGDRDGIPNVLVEAMAMGIPCVSTSISGIPELIDNGKNGLLVSQKDSDAFARALASLLESPADRIRLGQAAREKIETHFSAQNNVKKIGHLLRHALQGGDAFEGIDWTSGGKIEALSVADTT